MKYLSFIIGCLLLVLTIACSDEEKEHEMIVANCSVISNAKVLSTAEKDATCDLINIYSYQSDIYLTCSCCLCNKLSTAITCDSMSLCGTWIDIDTHNNCMEDFYEEATYLFSVEDF